MSEPTTSQLLAEAEADINRVTGLTQATRDEVSAVKSALNLLRTSSSANFPETIVFKVVAQLETAVESLEAKTAANEKEIVRILRRIAKRESPSNPFTPATSVTITQTGKVIIYLTKYSRIDSLHTWNRRLSKKQSSTSPIPSTAVSI